MVLPTTNNGSAFWCRYTIFQGRPGFIAYSKDRMMKSRFIAFSIHIAISFAVARISVYIVFFIWYPPPLDHDDLMFLDAFTTAGH